MSTPIQISLFKKSPKSPKNDKSEKEIQFEQNNSNKRQNLQPVVLLQRLNISEMGGNQIERSKGRNIEREVQFELIISNSYECSFCDDASFDSEELLNQHLVNFHHISKKKKSPIKATLDKGFIKNIETLLSKDIEDLAKKNSNKNIGTLSLKNIEELSKRRDGHTSNKNIETSSNKNIGTSFNKNINALLTKAIVAGDNFSSLCIFAMYNFTSIVLISSIFLLFRESKNFLFAAI